jgi:putative transposase
MKSRTKPALRAVPGAQVQLTMPVQGVLQEVKHAFQGLCLEAGRRVLAAMMEQDREALCGPKGVPDGSRVAVRGGSTRSPVVLGGQRIGIRRLRARGAQEGVGGELDLPSYAWAAGRDPLDAATMAAIAAGVSMRRYRGVVDPLPAAEKAGSVSKSATSRRFVMLSQAQLDAWLSQPLGGLDLPVLMVDGIHFKDRVILVALGIDPAGQKHILGLHEGSTESTGMVKELLGDLVGRGLDADRPRLVVIDGGRGLRRAITETFGRNALVQRCQEHKRRNVLDHLPDDMHASVGRALRDAWDCADADLAKRQLQRLATSLQAKHPGAASSLREGLDETLTVQGLGISGTLYRTLRTTNPIENLNGLIAQFTRNVKRWRDGEMTLRWIASAMSDAKQRFNKLRGHAQMPLLTASLAKHALSLQSNQPKSATPKAA